MSESDYLNKLEEELNNEASKKSEKVRYRQHIYSEDNDKNEVFIWDGNNSEAGRQEAGVMLYNHLKKLDNKCMKYILICHSHGGSVAKHCLEESKRKFGNFTDSEYKEKIKNDNVLLKGFTKLLTYGTPFMHYQIDFLRYYLTTFMALFSIVFLCLFFKSFAWLFFPNTSVLYRHIFFILSIFFIMSFFKKRIVRTILDIKKIVNKKREKNKVRYNYKQVGFRINKTFKSIYYFHFKLINFVYSFINLFNLF